ncbi:uncharacterized protein J3R85_000238 [Psidium guajava]|nr:uncharacterized protein J3R85_000238 [Psidium guajava]
MSEVRANRATQIWVGHAQVSLAGRASISIGDGKPWPRMTDQDRSSADNGWFNSRNPHQQKRLDEACTSRAVHHRPNFDLGRRWQALASRSPHQCFKFPDCFCS